MLCCWKLNPAVRSPGAWQGWWVSRVVSCPGWALGWGCRLGWGWVRSRHCAPAGSCSSFRKPLVLGSTSLTAFRTQRSYRAGFWPFFKTWLLPAASVVLQYSIIQNTLLLHHLASLDYLMLPEHWRDFLVLKCCLCFFPLFLPSSPGPPPPPLPLILDTSRAAVLWWPRIEFPLLSSVCLFSRITYLTFCIALKNWKDNKEAFLII